MRKFLNKIHIQKTEKVVDPSLEVFHKEIEYYNKNEVHKEILALYYKAHKIEKSMCMGDDKGLSTVSKYETMLEQLTYLLEQGVGRESYIIVETAATINAAIAYCISKGYEIAEFQKKFGQFVDEWDIKLHEEAGVHTLTHEQITSGKNFNFKEFVSSRHSIRHFQKDIIDENTIHKIIESSLYYPSACNRQPCKVYYSVNESMLTQIAKLIPDQYVVRGNIFNFFVVTCDRNLFSEGEIFQYYVNGGIYLGFLVEAIHAQGLGSCIFQFTQRNKNMEHMKELLGIPKSETLIAVVGFGVPKNSEKVPYGKRKDVREVAISVGETL